MTSSILGTYLMAGVVLVVFIVYRTSDTIVQFAPYFEQVEAHWGKPFEYLLITTFALALFIGFVVIWPLALCVEVMRALKEDKPE